MSAKPKQSTEIQELKSFISDRFNELKLEISDTKAELKQDINNTQLELKQDINNTQSELKEDIRQTNLKIESVKGDIKGLSEKILGLDKRLSNVEISSQKIPDLAEKVGEFKWWKQAILIVSSGSIGALLGKFFSNQNP